MPLNFREPNRERMARGDKTYQGNTAPQGAGRPQESLKFDVETIRRRLQERATSLRNQR